MRYSDEKDMDPRRGRNATPYKTNYVECRNCHFIFDKIKHPQGARTADYFNYFIVNCTVSS